ncbi:MAG: hypothetical protein ABJZ55_03700 [Fuerstiella sp.]
MTRTLCLLVLSFPISICSLHAADRSPTDLLPASCVLYAELAAPDVLIDTIFDHPIRQHVEQLPQWKQATQQDQYSKFLAGRKFFELQMDSHWRDASKALTAGGIYVAVDAKTEAVIMLVKADNASTMNRFRDKLLVLTQLGKSYQEAEKAKYGDIQAYEIDKSVIAVFDEWLLATNKPAAGKAVIDRWLDQGEGKHNNSLTQNEKFQTAKAARTNQLSGWGWADLKTLREAGVARKLFQGNTNNPGAELLAGGIMSTLTETPFATAEFKASTDAVSLNFRTPHDSSWVPEERSFYFGPNSSGTGPQLADVPETLFTLSTYRDVGEMWLRAGDLFDEQMNDKFAEADANLTTLFAGRDFGEDILGSLTPEVGLIAARQTFEDVLPIPAIKLPAFALVAEMKDPKTMTRELRRTFQSMVGFFNVIGAMEGRPQLEMEMDKRDDGSQTVTTLYLPEPDDADSTTADLIFNFSPSIGFRDSQVIISSSRSLVEKLLDAKAPEGNSKSNSTVDLNANVLQTVLQDNQQQLIAQNMLEDGNSQEEAEVAIGLLLQAVGLFQDASAQLDVSQNEISFGLNVRLQSQLAPAQLPITKDAPTNE